MTTTDPQSPYADPADVAEQARGVVSRADDDEVPDSPPVGVPLEANEADVAEQRRELPDDDDVGEP
jgi:hypothetical protein